jgi:hypothetical protein
MVGLHLFMAWGCGVDMTCGKYLRDFFLNSLLRVDLGRGWQPFVRPKGVWILSTPLYTGPLLIGASLDLLTPVNAAMSFV